LALATIGCIQLARERRVGTDLNRKYKYVREKAQKALREGNVMKGAETMNKVGRRGFVALVLSVVMAFSMLIVPVSASAAEMDTEYYYVEEFGIWVPMPVFQDTVGSVTDNGDGSFTVDLTYGYYYSDIFRVDFIGKVIAFDGVAQDGVPFSISPVTVDGGYVTFNFDPLGSKNYIVLNTLSMVMTYADDPDWDNPILLLPLTDVAFCPLGGSPVD
jgi:hypothetical protein